MKQKNMGFTTEQYFTTIEWLKTFTTPNENLNGLKDNLEHQLKQQPAFNQ